MNEHSPQPASISSEDGFTLPEVLVAIALTALLVSLLSGALNLSLKAWDASTEIDRAAQANMARDFLRRIVAAAEPVRIRGRNGNLQLVFRGEKQRLEFVTAMPERHVKAGLYKLVLYLVSEDSAAAPRKTSALMLDIAPFQPRGMEQLSQAQVTKLMNGVETFEIGYFGDSAGNGQPEWQSRWEQSDNLPSLIWVVIGSAEERREKPQTLVVEVRMR